MFARLAFPLAFVLLLACVAFGKGPVGPFEPSAPLGSANSDPGKCTQQKGVVYLSTYLSGYQLNEQGFDAPMGAVYYQGPKLTFPSVDAIRGEYCSSNNVVDDIPSMATGIIAWGDNDNEPMTSIYYDVNLVTSRAEFVGCGCKIKVYIKAKPVWATVAASSSTVKNENDVTIEGTCRSDNACSTLKVYTTQNWCSNPTKTADCGKGTFGTNAFVYFDGLNAASDAASIGAEGFANSTFADTASSPTGAPEEENADATPTSSASKASPLPLLVSMFALFSFGGLGNKRMLFVAILLATAAGAHGAGTGPSVRQDLGGALGQVLSSYINSLGRCTAYMNEVMISTGIDGKKLKFYFNPSPVGDAKYVGPKLELLGSQTNFAYGDYCDAAAPSVIPADSFGNIIIGDSYWGLASAELSIYYKVYKIDGSPSNCVLKLYMNDKNVEMERTPTYSLTKEGDCSDVPTLKINQLKIRCGMKGRSGGCIKDPKTGVNYFSTAYNVYFDGSTTAQADAPAAAEAASLADAAEDSSNAKDTTPSASSAAFTRFGAVKITAVAIVMSFMLTAF